MFKVIKLKTLLIGIAVLVLSAAIVTAVVLGVKKAKKEEKAFSPLPKQTIVIDAGHGGADPGVTGVKTGIKESDLNLKMALILGDLFSSAGYRSVQTRYGEGSTMEGAFDKSKDMETRRSVIRSSDPALVISIHMNKYEDASRRGVQVFYSTEESAAFAEEMQAHLNQTMNEPTLGRAFETIRGEYYIAESSDAPSIIIECAFLSNPIDESLISDSDYRLRLAIEIEKAAERYLSGNPS